MDVTELQRNSPVGLGPARLSLVFKAGFFFSDLVTLGTNQRSSRHHMAQLLQVHVARAESLGEVSS